MKKKLSENIDVYLNNSLIFNKFGIVNLNVLRLSTHTTLTNDELIELINEKYAKEMNDGKIDFLY